jgi:hypothetical protein
MRSVRRAAARSALVALIAAPVLVLSAGVASADPGITVDPTGPLAAGATVTVTASGFTPSTTVVVAQCLPDGSGAVASPLQCADASTGSSTVAAVDAQGAFTATLTITVGDIRSGVSCTGDACVIGAISTATTADQALAPVSLTGSGTSLPAPTATPSSTPSATPSSTPSAEPSTTPTPEPSSSEPTAEPQTSTPAPTNNGNGNGNGNNANSGGKPGKLAVTGPEDAGLSLVVGIVALQLGLMVAVRARRATPVAVTGGGRHRR